MRHKINTHVLFPQLIDLTKYCIPPKEGVVSLSHDVMGGGLLKESNSGLYTLSSVIIHHGVGFQSGHYTAYCWNAEACKSSPALQPISVASNEVMLPCYLKVMSASCMCC